jgi:flavin reductase (DIM6/NTAB) family NADH-FMN oxidoreductase RutF
VSTNPVDAEKALAAALGRVPSGLFVLTARHGKHETGMLASWVQQCSFDPPQLSAAIRKGRFLLDWLTDGAAFVVNVLAEGQKSLLGHFGKGFELGEPAFEGIAVRRSTHTATVVLAAHAYLDCRVVGFHEAGDHVLVIGRVVGGEVLHEARPATHVRKSGMHY